MRFLWSVYIFSLFCFYLILEKRIALICKNLNFLYQWLVCGQVLLKLAQWFSRRRKKCEMFRDRQTTDGQTKKQTDGRQTIGDKISSLEYSMVIVFFLGGNSFVNSWFKKIHWMINSKIAVRQVKISHNHFCLLAYCFLVIGEILSISRR